MNQFWRKILTLTILRKKNPEQRDANQYSNFELAKAYRVFLINSKRLSKDFLLIVLGIFCAAFGVNGFLIPNSFIDGGVTGISLLISAITQIPLYILIIGVNIPFMILAYKVVNRQFTIKTVLAILGLSVVLATVSFPSITNDKLLVAVFGGFFLGGGIGFAVRGGAVIDGTEVLAIYLSRKLGTTIGDIIAIINVMIFGAVAYYLGIENALYSMITYLSASKTLDFIVEGIEAYIGVTIVALRNEEIRQMIISEMGRGVTVYSGNSGYGKRGEIKKTDIIYTIVTRLELNKLITEIEKIEPDAFVVMTSVKDLKGGMIKRRRLKH